MRHRILRRRVRFGLWHRLALVLLLCLALVVAAYIRIRPVVTAYAENRARLLAEQVANETMAAVLVDKAALCSSMLEVTYNEQQVLSSVMADAAAVNTVKTEVAASVLEALRGLTTMEVGIPFGTLMGPDWLSGWGPLVYFPVGVSPRVLTTVSSSLEAVGMNQSAYRVLLNVHISLSVVTPEGHSSVTVDSTFPMAEAVLLGKVPDALTEVYGDDQTLLGKIFDYGTVE